MDAKRAREGQTPGRTPGKNDFKRPTFALGRISFGVDDDDSSSSSSNSSAEYGAFGAARSKALSPISSGRRVPLAPAAGAENGGSVGAGAWKMSSGAGGGGGRASVLADRSLRENARVDMDEDQQHQRRRSPFSSPAVGSARHAGGGGGGGSGGHSKAAATAAARPRDYRRRSLNESWGSPVVAGESGRQEASPLPAAVSGKTPRDRRDFTDPARGSGPPPPEKDRAAAPSDAGAGWHAGAGEESPAIGTGSPGDVGAGPEDFPEAWDDGVGMYDDYGDDFGSGGVYTYSPSPPRSSAAAPAVGNGAGSSSFRSSFGGPVSSGNSSSNARDSAGGNSSAAAASPVDTSHVLDLSTSSPPPPPTSRFSKEALPPRSPTVASGNRRGRASEGIVVCSDDDDDDFVDCLGVEEAGNTIPARGNGGAHDRGRSGTGPKKPPSKHGSGSGGDRRFGLGNSGSLAGGAAARQPSKAFGRGRYSSSSSSEDDDSDDFSMVVSTKRRGSGTARTAGASASTFAGPAAGRASLGGGGGGDGGRYEDLVVGVAGEWRREAGGRAWKMAASGGGGGGSGNASGGSESDDDGDESDDYELTPKKKKEAFSVPAELYNRMYAHQRIGVRWLWSLHQGDMGGILGDDMGLGKTFQVTCFLAGLFGTRQAKSALVLAPKSVMRGWEDELGRWLVKAACPKAEVVVMASEMPAKARRRAIALAAEGGSRGRGAVLITTYGMVSSNPKQFAPAVGGSGGWIERGEPRQHVWDYVILDEGHKIKNASTKTCKAVHSLPTKRRLLLTGTPVQNNLKELHTVVDWATFGKLLGPYKYFKTAFSRPIEYGQDRDASEKAVLRSRARAAELRQMLEPLLLQRTKGEIMDEKATTKTEMVVWVALSPLQRKVYVKYLGGESVKGILSGEVSSPLGAISHLKKVCLHPLVSSYPLDEPWILDPEVSVSSLLKDCNKLEVTLNIVKEACSAGHRVLVFSRFVRMLDIIERCINEDRGEGGAGLRVCRIDGGHSDLERQHTIARFNANNKISVCLVSTGAGGTGITLTGADRVILFDPSWNPADDMQAVDRAYRIGQKRDVIVYRMIAAGTVEEKMYEKQIFKDGLRRTVMGGTVKRKKNVRYFSRAELKQLFTLFPAGACRVLDQLNQMHGPLSGRLEAAESRAQRDISLDGHLDFVCGLRGAYGASAHGDGLPKIVQQPAAEGGSSIGGGGQGGWHTRNQIDEEEDESEVEDSDGGAGAGARGVRGGGMAGLLEEDLIALELDLDDDSDDDDHGGGRSMAPRATGRKGKGPSRLLRHHRRPSGMESSSSISDFDDGKEGGSGAVLDLSVAGADRSTAIALSGDSDSECEFGGTGSSKGHDVVELMDNDDDDDDDDRADGKASVGLPRTPVAINSSGGAYGSGSIDASREGLGTPESWSVSPPPPGSPPPIGAGSANSDSPMSTGSGGGGCESPGTDSRPLWEWKDPEGMGYEEEKKETKGGIEEPRDSASASSPFMSGHSIVGDSGDGVSPALSAKEGEEGEAPAAVRAGRERARRWANDELGISLSPVASSSPSGRGGGGGGGGTTGGDTAEEDETLRRASSASKKKVSAARKRAREFAVEELGAEIETDGRHRLSRSYSSGDDDGLERCNPRDVQGEEEDEEQHGDYRSSDDSMDGGEEVGASDGGERDEVDSVDSPSTGGNAEDGCVAEEEEEDDGGGSFSSAMMIVDSSSPVSVAAPKEPTASADDGPGTSSSSSSRWNDGIAAAPYSSPCPSSPLLVGWASGSAGGRREEAKAAVGGQSPPNDPVLLATPARNNGDGDDGPTPKLEAAGRVGGQEGGGGYGAGPKSVRSSASSRSSYETAGSSHPRDVDEVAAVAAEPRGDGSFGGHERGDGDAIDVGSSSRPKACVASPSSGGGGGGGAERSPDGGAACDNDQRSGSEGLQETPAEFSPVPPVHAPALAPSSPAGAGAGADFAPPAAAAAAAAAAVCAAHKAAAESAGFTCRRCSCAAGAEAAEQAKGLLFEAWSNEREGDMYAAMGVCLEAIKLCDEDMELHKTISRIGSRMGCLS